MTDIMKTDMTIPVESAANAERPAPSVSESPAPAEQPTAMGGVSLKTALRILETIYKNGHESVGFWAAKTAYSGVYRTAVKNGWIEEGLFVTDIPEGVDGGFLAADMRRISLMAKLLADVLSDCLGDDASLDSPTVLDEAVSRAIEERVRDLLSETSIEAKIAEAFEDALAEIENLKDEAIEEIEAAKNH